MSEFEKKEPEQEGTAPLTEVETEVPDKDRSTYDPHQTGAYPPPQGASPTPPEDPWKKWEEPAQPPAPNGWDRPSGWNEWNDPGWNRQDPPYGQTPPPYGQTPPPPYGMTPLPYGNYGQEPPKESNGFGIASLVLGIISLVGCCSCTTPITGIVGIILGILQIVKKRGKRGMAIGGIVTSAVGLIAFIIFWAILFSSSVVDEELQNEFDDLPFYHNDTMEIPFPDLDHIEL